MVEERKRKSVYVYICTYYWKSEGPTAYNRIIRAKRLRMKLEDEKKESKDIIYIYIRLALCVYICIEAHYISAPLIVVLTRNRARTFDSNYVYIYTLHLGMHLKIMQTARRAALYLYITDERREKILGSKKKGVS